ncbi:hypothetical protein B9Z45_16115 [Limnohabitans sp. 2KL-17]|uniref:GNAT family N-acetyltransferase n=1 Tax=Limnohabitans sp. 2KL-17 TaxID=1100704 RepID=UPI000D33C324|nr:GNAT family N-acetyltransferase [Limnohabitans sp. 2KL-17]PUE48522.1 hypothetical protein B9Z45_16115 [Limnohabitans sp. 2KL-17]
MSFEQNIQLDDGEIRLHFTAKEVDLSKNGWGTNYNYDIKIKDNCVGRCELRLGSGATIDLIGHVGYLVHLPYRGHHYAAKACLLLFKQAKAFGIMGVLLTCNTDNIASFRTCELLGASFIGTKEVPVDHELYLRGDREKALFIKRLD